MVINLLGGHDWDNMIVKHLAEQWRLGTGLSDNPLDSPETLMDLWFKAEAAKRTLSVRQETRVAVTHAGERVPVTLTRVEFEKLTAHLLERTIILARKTINEAKKHNIAQIDQILLVGAATKMTQVAEQLRKEFGTPLRMLTSDGIVAKGAALYGYRLYSQGEKFSATMRVVDSSITNVASHSIGIIVTIDADTPRKRKVIVNLIPANDPLPVSRRMVFFTSEDNQEVIELELIENVKTTDVVELVDYSLLVTAGKIYLSLPPSLPAQSPIEVTFSLDQQERFGKIVRLGSLDHADRVVKACQKGRESQPIASSRFHDHQDLSGRSFDLRQALMQEGKTFRGLFDRDRLARLLMGGLPGDSGGGGGNVNSDKELIDSWGGNSMHEFFLP